MHRILITYEVITKVKMFQKWKEKRKIRMLYERKIRIVARKP
jgi:hypothetical protein